MSSRALAPRPSAPDPAPSPERRIDEELRRLRAAAALLPGEGDAAAAVAALRERGGGRRDSSGGPFGGRAGAPAPPPRGPLSRAPRRASTSAEGTLGADAEPADYYEHQHDTWRRLLALQRELTRDRAHPLYAEARGRLEAFADGIPTLAGVDAWLWQNAGWHVVRADGYVESRAFLTFVSQGQFPCMDLLRHRDELFYSPEPDMYHDVVGHLPMLCNRRFGEYTRTFGRAGTNARHPEQLAALDRIYWFTMEFGLAREGGAPGGGLAYGAALLTGLGELLASNGAAVTRRPFCIDDVLQTAIDVHRPNDVLFVTSDFDHLLATFVDWARAENLL